jgi:hypothetical protein
MAELSGLGGSAATQQVLPAACLEHRGRVTCQAEPRLPTAKASSNCGPAGNSAQVILVPEQLSSVPLLLQDHQVDGGLLVANAQLLK